jgi:hypothetical protein
MSRVLIAILPVGFLFIVYFLNDLNNHIKNSKYIIYPIIIITLLFPFTKNKSAWSKADFKQDETITKLEALKPKINNLISDKTTVLYTSYPILTLLDYDVYDTIQFKLFTNKNYHTFEKDTNCIMILDTWTTQYDYNANDALLKVNSKSLIIKENISENNDLKVYINK